MVAVRLHHLASALFFACLFASTACAAAPGDGGRGAFEAANGAFDGGSNDVGFGNTPAATDMARRFALRLKKLGAVGLDRDAVTHGKFIAFCEQRGSNVVFLVQAPELDGDEAHATLFRLAWQAAQEVTGKRVDRNLVVALRDRAHYAAFGQGRANAAAPVPRMHDAIDESALYPYFAPSDIES